MCAYRCTCDPKHGLFPFKGPLSNDPNTFFIRLFLINSAPFSLKGLDFGTCVCRSFGPWTQADWIRPGLPAKRRRHESVVYSSIGLSISLSLSIYPSICTGKPEKPSVRVDAARSIHSTEDMVQV